jgi:hypothetical protein
MKRGGAKKGMAKRGAAAKRGGARKGGARKGGAKKGASKKKTGARRQSPVARAKRVLTEVGQQAAHAVEAARDSVVTAVDRIM